LAATLLAARTPSAEEPGLEIVEEVLGASTLLGGASIPQHDNVSDDELELARDVRLFHARVIEAVEAAVETLVNDIAAEVLGRELALAPVDIERIVDRVLQRFAEEEPLRVRVHADDAARVTCGVPVVADPRLRPGDAVIELRGGSVDASLGVRLTTLVRESLA
jgi:flagellar biosynthesis/type III secretory pathway protein FliH